MDEGKKQPNAAKRTWYWKPPNPANWQQKIKQTLQIPTSKYPRHPVIPLVCMFLGVQSYQTLRRWLDVYRPTSKKTPLTWIKKRYLVGGFNQSEKYARQIGSFPQVGMKIKIFLSCHHLGIISPTPPIFHSPPPLNLSPRPGPSHDSRNFANPPFVASWEGGSWSNPRDHRKRHLPMDLIPMGSMGLVYLLTGYQKNQP